MSSINPSLKHLAPISGDVASVRKIRVGLHSIRGNILASFLLIAVFTSVLGYFSAITIRHAGALALQIYDKSLMSINFARAAAADFALMNAEMIRLDMASDPAVRAETASRAESLWHALREDLDIAAERSQSGRATSAAHSISSTVDRWKLAWADYRANRDAGIDAVDAQRQIVGLEQAIGHEIDLLVNYTAGDGFLFRQDVLRSIDADTKLDIGLTIAVLALSGVAAWTLGKRIIGPVSTASAVAGRIAGGELDVPVPTGSADEMGALLRSMSLMRDAIRTMMEREVEQRRSAQSRLMDAVDSSREGVVLVDSDDRIVVSNSQMREFFADQREQLRPGASFSRFLASLPRLVPEPDEAAAPGGRAPRARVAHCDLPDGRSVRLSRSTTREGGIVAFCGDMTLWKRREAELRRTNLWFDAALTNMSQGLCLFDGEGRLKTANQRFRDIFHLQPGEVRPEMTFKALMALKLERCPLATGSWLDLWRQRMDLLAQGSPFLSQIRLADGRVIAVAHQPMPDGGWVTTYEDVTDRHQAEAKILYIARHDALTNLPNRLLFAERMDEALGRRATDEAVSVLCIDLDFFKTVNDTLGHAVGDALLDTAGRRFLNCVRDTDTVARLGGDEFAIIQTGVRDAVETETLARRIIEIIGQPYVIDGRAITIGASVGIALAPKHGQDRDTLLRNADIALYRAKANGRGCHSMFEPEMQAMVQERHTLETDLRHALVRDEMELVYQPVMDVATSRIAGFEALLRWRHPAHGVIGPDRFIPLAEETGLIGAIGAWVIHGACAAAATWPARMRVAINVSPMQVTSTSLIETIERALDASGVEPSRVELEITETALLYNTEGTVATLRRLNGLGVKIALDDFGTGYSALSYLRSFPFDRIKIDRSFVGDLMTNDGVVSIVRAIVGLADSLGMPTTAEGVETERQFHLLRAAGCESVQGFLIGRPQSGADIRELLQNDAPHSIGRSLP